MSKQIKISQKKAYKIMSYWNKGLTSSELEKLFKIPAKVINSKMTTMRNAGYPVMVKNKRWSDEEDSLLLNAVSSNPLNLTQCFEEFAERSNRTVKSVSLNYYRNARMKEFALKIVSKGDNIGFNRKNAPRRSDA